MYCQCCIKSGSARTCTFSLLWGQNAQNEQNTKRQNERQRQERDRQNRRTREFVKGDGSLRPLLRILGLLCFSPSTGSSAQMAPQVRTGLFLPAFGALLVDETRYSRDFGARVAGLRCQGSKMAGL